MKRHKLGWAIAAVGILAVAVAVMRLSTFGMPDGVASEVGGVFAALRRWMDGLPIHLTATQLQAAAAAAWLVFVLSLILLARSRPVKQHPRVPRLIVSNATTLPDVKRHQQVQATEASQHTALPPLPVRPAPRDGSIEYQELTPEARHDRASSGQVSALWAPKYLEEQPAGRYNPGADTGGNSDGGALGKGQGHTLALTGVSVAQARVRRYGLFIVAEDTGNARAGDEASQRAIEVIAEQMAPVLASDQTLGSAQFSALLRMAVTHACIDLRQRAVRTATDLNAAIAVVMVIGRVAHVASDGACRAFIFRAGDGLLQLMPGRVAESRPVEEGQAEAVLVEADAIRDHPQCDQIYSRADDNQAAAEVDVLEVILYPDDLLLLCGPRLWQALPPSQIEAILRAATDSSRAADQLTRAAASHTGKQDFSVIAVHPLQDWMAASGVAASGGHMP